MITANKATSLLLAKSMNRTGTTAKDPSASTYISDGEIVVTDVAGTILDSTTVIGKDKIVLVQSQGATKPPIKSNVIERNKVTSYKGAKANVAVEQVTYIGYDGTTSTLKIDPLNSNQYIGRVLLQGEQNTFGNRDMYKQFDYYSDATATQAEIAENLQLSLIANFSKMPDRYAKFEMVNAATFTIMTAAAGTLTATYGSTVVTCSGGTPSTDVSAGSFIRFGSAASVATTVKTNPVYEVASVDDAGNGTITLTVPYQGASGTFTIANTAAAFATSATALAANFGVKLTGVAKTYRVGKFRYYKNRYKVLLLNSEWGATSVTYTTGASEGQGTTEQIQDLEWFCQDGNIYRVSVPPFVERTNAVTYLSTNAGFSTAEVSHYNQDFGGIGMTEASSQKVILGFVAATADGSTANTSEQVTGVVTSVITVLNAWIGTTPGPFTDLTL